MTHTPIDLTWSQRGACRNEDTALFFPEFAHPKSSARIMQAKEICMRCSVRLQCVDYALKYENVGIWGGMTEAERRRHRLKHNIQMDRDRFGLQHFLPVMRPAKREQVSAND